MNLVWTEQAYARLAEIHDFVAADSPVAAERLVGRLIRRAEALARFPDSGRRLPEIPASDLREGIEGNYRLVYRKGPGRIEMITVFEGHRLLPMEDLGPATSA